MGVTDGIIAKLIESKEIVATEFPLAKEEIEYLIDRTNEIFISQPTLLNIDTPVTIAGDIHGQYEDLLEIFEQCGYPPHTSYLFLGDYVDRGKKSLETICLLYALKIKYPNNFFITRGNHECSSISRIYGFYDECKKKVDVGMWKRFTSSFENMPLAAVVNKRIFCVHGGLSPDLSTLDQLTLIKRPIVINDTGIVTDLLHSRVDESHEGWKESSRGISFTFGKDVVDKFLSENNLSLLCRSHCLIENGFQFTGEKILTIFSAKSYSGDFDNLGAVAQVDSSLNLSFKQFSK